MLLQVLQRSNIVITHKHKFGHAYDLYNQDSKKKIQYPIKTLSRLFNQHFNILIME